MLIPQIENMKIVLSTEVAINAIMDRTDHTVVELTTPHPLLVHIMRVSDVEYAVSLGNELFVMFWDGKRLGLEQEALPRTYGEYGEKDDDDEDDETDHA